MTEEWVLFKGGCLVEGGTYSLFFKIGFSYYPNIIIQLSEKYAAYVHAE